MRNEWMCGLAFAGLALVPLRALAVEPLDTFSVRVGGYVSTFDTNVRANGHTTAGTEIDLNRDLGLDQSGTIGYAGLSWRPWEHHEFGFTWYRDSSDTTRVLQRDITFQDTTFVARSAVNSKVALDAYEVHYIWWAAEHDNWALGPRVGLIWYRFDMSMALQADINGNPVGGALREEATADLPSPTLGGSWRWVPAKDWRISADAGFFKANVDHVDANVRAGRVGVEWFPWERAGFSLDYVVSRIRADAQKTHFNGDFHFTDKGLRAGFVYRF